MSTSIKYHGEGKTATLTVTMTAGALGAFENEVLNANGDLNGFYLQGYRTNPGATAPTDDYDIAITDSEGVNVAAGLANRDTTNTEDVFPDPYMIDGPLTVAITNNSVVGAIVVLKINVAQ